MVGTKSGVAQQPGLAVLASTCFDREPGTTDVVTG